MAFENFFSSKTSAEISHLTMTNNEGTVITDQHPQTDYDVFSGPSDVIAPPPAIDHDHPDFIWSLKEEPHFSRRKEILKKYPQIQKLFGVDTNIKWVVLGWVAIQLTCALVFRDAMSFQSPWFWLTAFVIGM